MPKHRDEDVRRFTFDPYKDKDRSHEKYPNTIYPYSSYRRRRQSYPYFILKQHSDHSEFKRRGSLPLHISHHDHFKFPDSGFGEHRDISLDEGHFGKGDGLDFKKIGRDKDSPPGPVTPLLQDEENKKFHSKMRKGHEKLAKNTKMAQNIVEQETTSSTEKSIAQLTQPQPQPLQKEESFYNLVSEQPPEENILETASTNAGTDIKDMEYPNISDYKF